MEGRGHSRRLGVRLARWAQPVSATNRGLPSGYPMVAPGNKSARSSLAKSLGFGGKPGVLVGPKTKCGSGKPAWRLKSRRRKRPCAPTTSIAPMQAAVFGARPPYCLGVGCLQSHPIGRWRRPADKMARTPRSKCAAASQDGPRPSPGRPGGWGRMVLFVDFLAGAKSAAGHFHRLPARHGPLLSL